MMVGAVKQLRIVVDLPELADRHGDHYGRRATCGAPWTTDRSIDHLPAADSRRGGDWPYLSGHDLQPHHQRAGVGERAWLGPVRPARGASPVALFCPRTRHLAVAR